jgi:hypothetical protein
MSKPQTFTEYAASEGVTPHSLYADIIDALIEWYSTKRPHATMEQVERWADTHAARWAR